MRSAAPTQYFRALVTGLDPIATSSYPTSRSLLADVEIKAHCYRAPLQAIDLHLNGAALATAYCFERRLGELTTGIHDGIVVLSSQWEPHLFSWLCHRLQDLIGCDIATFRVIGEGIPAFSFDAPAVRNRSMMAATDACVLQEVLPLPEKFDDFVTNFGRNARRNILRGLDYAQQNTIAFHFAPEAMTFNMPGLRELARKNMPHRQPFNRVARIVRFVAEQPRPFGAALIDREGRWISAAGGFIEGDLAVMAYQSNHRDFREANPSLTLRSLLVEQLIAQGVRRLAFVGSCAGTLLRYCERVPGAELLLVRNTVAARMKHLACVLARPKSRIARLAHGLGKGTGDASPAPNVFWHDEKDFEQARSELTRIAGRRR